MAKTINGAIGFVSGTTPTANYIKQINAGDATYDIAVEHGIKFFNGSDGDAILWDGTRPLEVVIPTLADIVANPVVLSIKAMFLLVDQMVICTILVKQVSILVSLVKQVIWQSIMIKNGMSSRVRTR